MRVGVGTLVGRCAAGAGASGSDLARTSRLVLSGIPYIMIVIIIIICSKCAERTYTHSRASANVPSPSAGSKRLGVLVLNSDTCRV